MNKHYKILVTDDHALYRKAIRNLIEGVGNYTIFEACNGREAINQFKTQRVDLILLDISMPELDGLSAAKIILKDYPYSDVRIIINSIYTERLLIDNLKSLGVHGYLSKSEEEGTILMAISKVLGGGFFFPDEDSQGHFFKESSTQIFQISDNDRQLLKLLVDGLTSKEIADVMGYTTRTVETKRLRLERKLLTKNTAQLISFAYRTGILQL